MPGRVHQPKLPHEGSLPCSRGLYLLIANKHGISDTLGFLSKAFKAQLLTLSGKRKTRGDGLHVNQNQSQKLEM